MTMTMAGVEATPRSQREESKEASSLPWWKRGLSVGAITAVLGAMVPATTAVSGYFQKHREVALQQEKDDNDQKLKELELRHNIDMEEVKLKHSMQTDFLDRTKNDSERLRTLRFVAITSDDPKMAKWAGEERDLIQTDLEAAQKKAAEQATIAADAQAKLAAAVQEGKAKAATIAQLKANAANQQKELARVSDDLTARTQSPANAFARFRQDPEMQCTWERTVCELSPGTSANCENAYKSCISAARAKK